MALATLSHASAPPPQRHSKQASGGGATAQLRDSLHRFKARVAALGGDGAQQELLGRMSAEFDRVAAPERNKFLLLWPRDSARPTSVGKLVRHERGLGAAQPPADAVHYDFVRLLLAERKNNARRKRAPQTALRAPDPRPAKKQRRLEYNVSISPWGEWPGFTKQLYMDAFTPRVHHALAAHFCRDAHRLHHHFPCRLVAPQTHKLCFSLPEACIKMANIIGGSIHLAAPPAPHRCHRLIASNCVLRLPERAHFRGLQIFVTGGGVGGAAASTQEVQFDAALLYDAGKLELDLAALSAPRQLCYVVSPSELTLVFAREQPGVMLLAAAARADLDLESCFLEYWSEPPLDSDQRPHAYVIEDADYIARLGQMREEMRGSGSSEGNNSPVAPALDVELPRRYFSQSASFCDGAHRYALLQRSKVYFIGGVPYLFLDQQQLQLAQCGEQFTVLYEGASLATFRLDRLARQIRFRIIYSEQSRPLNSLSAQFIY